MDNVKIRRISGDSTIDLALDTISIGKQSLVFVNSKRSAEKTAEDISKKVRIGTPLIEISEQVLKALPRPTKQCERLAKIIKKGVAFHHAGLTQKQKEIIEDNFRLGKVKIIACTPTLCLSGDSMIWHGMNETKVSKFKNSHSVFALSKNRLISIKPQKIQKLKNSFKLIKITSVSGYSIKVTLNHKMLIKRNNKKKIVQAENIKKTDKIATIGKLNIKKTKIPRIKEFIIDRKVDLDNFKFFPELSYFIGVMLGDGYSGAEFIDRKIKYKGSPSIVGIDKEIFSNAKEICKILKLDYRKTKNYNGTPQIILGKNNWFREFLVRCGVEKREKKHISKRLMKMDLENTAAILRGLFDTDGCVEKRGQVSFSNISLQLIKQMQKMLLRFNIVTRIRRKKEGNMKIYEKEYKTVPCFELLISNKKSILNYYKFIGFNIKHKENDLINVIAKIASNLNYLECKECSYKIYKDLFSGRNKNHKSWGKQKLEIIKLLGKNDELISREIKKILNFEPRKKETRTNHHYELINKRRIGSQSATEWLWSLNPIGNWTFTNIINKNKKFEELFKLRNCPICNTELDWIIKKGWRDSDFDGDIFWDQIRNIKEVNYEESVYDVVLPNKPNNNHMFVANGFIVHNSAGIDMPSFRTILKDLRRFSHRGLNWIPVLEYEQMAGRSGRPKYDDYGEAIAVAASEKAKKDIFERYVCGEPEEIYSKLAVEPVLRMYVLSLIATRFVTNRSDLIDFFAKTFWAHQFEDLVKLEKIIDKVLGMLEEFEFIRQSKGSSDFVTAADYANEGLKATLLGERVAQLYIDPLTAHNMIFCLKNSDDKTVNVMSMLNMVSRRLEMRPFLRVKTKEWEKYQKELAKFEDNLLEKEPSLYDPEYDDFLNSFKTSLFLHDWVEEKAEDEIMEKFDVRPGEIKVKLDKADWLLYAAEELCKLMAFHKLVKEIVKTRFRLKYGVREELLPLLKLKGIGRARARKLFNNKIKTIKDIKSVDIISLVELLGKAIALKVKEQVDQNIEKEKVPERKRKGQISLLDY